VSTIKQKRSSGCEVVRDIHDWFALQVSLLGELQFDKSELVYWFFEKSQGVLHICVGGNSHNGSEGSEILINMVNIKLSTFPSTIAGSLVSAHPRCMQGLWSQSYTMQTYSLVLPSLCVAVTLCNSHESGKYSLPVAEASRLLENSFCR
jgi:hypothetical protein